MNAQLGYLCSKRLGESFVLNKCPPHGRTCLTECSDLRCVYVTFKWRTAGSSDTAIRKSSAWKNALPVLVDIFFGAIVKKRDFRLAFTRLFYLQHCYVNDLKYILPLVMSWRFIHTTLRVMTNSVRRATLARGDDEVAITTDRPLYKSIGPCNQKNSASKRYKQYS